MVELHSVPRQTPPATIRHMASPLLSYSEAAEQVHRFILARAEGNEIPFGPESAGLDIDHSDLVSPVASPETGIASRSPEIVALAAAAGRVLAAPILADRDQPPFHRSTRDGFACRAAEANSHQFLFLAGRIRAGEVGTGEVGIGEVWEIMTGAPVPQGADAVFMVEHADHNFNSTSDFVRLLAPRTVQPGENIVPKGTEARTGDLLVPPGVRLTSAQIALAAQCGYSEVAVVRQPRVAILSTGDELVPIETVPGPSQIRNSNSPMLAALVAAAGAVPIVLPTVPDQEAPLEAALGQALSPAQWPQFPESIPESIDLLLITGGISAGRFDLVEDALTRLGARFFFGGVAIQPGKPVVFGQLPRPAGLGIPGRPPLPFFALPGNPISSAVTFHLFAAPLLAALGDDSSPQPRFAQAQLAGKWSGKPGLTRFLPAHCDFSLNAELAPEVLGPEVRLTPWQGSGDLAAFARSNCFVVIPPEAQELIDGSPVQILFS
jgi:molybdopterin molybdotransferase